MKYKDHPLAGIFPLIQGQEFKLLCEDIKAHGLNHRITLYDGKVLDGRNRQRACLKVDVTPLYEEYEGDKPLEYVISLNVHRRHLNEASRSLVASNIATLKHGQKKGANLHLTTISQASKLLNVSTY